MSVFGVFQVLFFRIQTEYGNLLCKSPYSVKMQEIKDLKNSEYGHFLRSISQYYFRLGWRD